MTGRLLLLLALATTWAGNAPAYPVYGSESTGIRRLEHARLAHEGEVEGRARLPGETLPVEEVDLRLVDRADFELPAPDPELGRRIEDLLGEHADRYSVSVLDLSDPDRPAYAELAGDAARNPGSVGKLAVGAALFQALADAWPEDLARREEILRETVVTADEFIVSDHHTVRFWDPGRQTLERRPLAIGDRGTLYEYLDWMLSASSNAAAATVQKQAMLLRRFGREYPVDDARAARFLEETPKSELGEIFLDAMVQPLERGGLDPGRFRQGSFFTRTGKQRVPGTNSYATTRELLRYLLRLEQGRIVDEFSSRELKRLLYVTERRIRYASSPALHGAAVYFKSGSLYACQPEPGFECRKYHGNKYNYMNSAVIVEAPAGERRLYYMVTLTSNVLKRNSAVDHQTFATRLHRLIERRHATE